MAWDQADQPKTGQTGTTLEAPVVKPADNVQKSAHELFVSDFLTNTTASTGATPATLKATLEAAPKVTAAPKAEPANPLFPETPTYSAPRTMEPPRFSAPVVQSFAPPQAARGADFRTVAPPQANENFYGRTPQGQGGVLTYRAMSRAQQMAQGGDNGQMAAENTQMAGRTPARPDGPFRRLFQPVLQPQERRQPPAGVPQEQPRQRLFGRPNRGDAPAPKNVPMQKIEFKAANETGIIKEMNLPANFKEVPKDPNLAPGEDPIRREFANGNSRVSIYEGRELSADERATLKTVLGKPGPLTETSKGYEDTLMLMGSGYFNFFNDPKVSVGKFQGKEALFLTDRDAQNDLVGQTVFVQSDKGQFLYAINFQGSAADFKGVENGLKTIQWRPTPDVVKPPAPVPKKK